MLLVCAVDDGCAADLGLFMSHRVERPAADLLTPDHVLDEEDAFVEAQRETVKQLQVLQKIIIGIPEFTKKLQHK